MTDATAATDAGTADAAATPAAPMPKPKPETDWQAEARKWESRAKENKSAADKLAVLEAAQMTEQERAQRALQQAQEDAARARSEALRFRIAAEFGLSADDADLYLTASDEDTMRRQAQGLADRAAATAAPSTPRPDPTQGARASATALNGDPLLDGVKAKLGIR